MPTSTPPEEPPVLRGRNRYEDLDHSDLLHVIEELEGSRSWTSLREKIWIALIIHMLVAWYLIYGPKYIYHVRVVDPSIVLKDRQKDMTYLDLPSDALKQVKPKTPAPISDHDRIAETKRPTLDQKTLQQLEAMRRAGPPKPVPEPSQQQSNAPAMPNIPAPAQPQVAQTRPQTPPAQPLPQNNQAKLEAPSAPVPNFRAGPSNPNEQIQQAMRQASRGGIGQFGGDDGQNAPLQHPGINGAVEVLSDTQGVDFGPYIQQVIAMTKRSWYPQIPESARPPLMKQGQVGIRFSILPDGTVRAMILELPSGDVSLDRAAWGGITGAAPYPPLPKAFHGPSLDLRFYFLYNIRPGQE
ncbi:cell envelope integrity protein TolA [Paracidobacterium acidisoli]|uniref:cell envelope integrity protein TolA n=1 Tax=Paracidobacterium acidisoli TaxID=2303751 RepID=UPI0013141964